MFVFLVCLSTLSEVARNGRVIDQTGSEELASVLKDGRIATNISEVSTDLCQISRVKTASNELEITPRTTSILMTSWPDRCRNICSKISTGNSVKWDTGANMTEIKKQAGARSRDINQGQRSNPPRLLCWYPCPLKVAAFKYPETTCPHTRNQVLSSLTMIDT